MKDLILSSEFEIQNNNEKWGKIFNRNHALKSLSKFSDSASRLEIFTLRCDDAIKKRTYVVD